MISLSKLSKTVIVALSLAVVTICTLVFTTVAKPTVAVTQQSFPLTCRGGGSLSITNEGRNNVRINFQKASGPVTAGIKPGQCTWLDRALRAGEEPILRDTGTRASTYVGKLVQDNEYVTLQVQNAGDYLRVTTVGP